MQRIKGLVIGCVLLLGTELLPSIEFVEGTQLSFVLQATAITEELNPSEELKSGESAAGSPLFDLKSFPTESKEKRFELGLKPNFLATTFQDSQKIFNPNSAGSVGPKQYIAMTAQGSGRIRSFDKQTGLPDGILNTLPELFFSKILPRAFEVNWPRVEYDRLSDRWFIVATNEGDADTNSIMLAVSDRGIVTPSTVWRFYSFTSTIPGVREWTTLGIDQHALYIADNLSDITVVPNKFITSEAFVINKKQLLNKDPSTQVPYTFFKAVGSIYTQGVDVFDKNSRLGFFIGLDIAQTNTQLDLFIVKDPGQIPMLSTLIPVSIPTTVPPPINVPQKGTTVKVTPNPFLSRAHVRNESLYTAQTALLNSDGLSTPTGDRDGCRWFKIHVDVKKPQIPYLDQTGLLYSRNPDLNEARFYFLPAVMTNGLNNMVIGANTAGTNHFVDASFAVRYAGEAPSKLHKQLITHSNSPFTLFGPRLPAFWGQYANASIDPSDNMSIWSIQEYALASNNWGVQVCRIPAAPPPKEVVVYPYHVEWGEKCVKLCIRGKSENGRVFYEPGKGFPNHLEVTFSGLIEVKRVVYIDPTHIEVVVSTQQAIAGQHDLRITNPDGQSVTIRNAVKVGECP